MHVVLSFANVEFCEVWMCLGFMLLQVWHFKSYKFFLLRKETQLVLSLCLLNWHTPLH